MSPDLASYNIKKMTTGSCPCGHLQWKYRLPIKLDVNILPYLKQLGVPAHNFHKEHLLVIEHQDYSITGIKRIREIKFTLKNKQSTHFQDIFENSLIEYIKNNPKV